MNIRCLFIYLDLSKFLLTVFYSFQSVRTNVGVVEKSCLLLVGCLASAKAHELHGGEETTKYRHTSVY